MSMLQLGDALSVHGHDGGHDGMPRRILIGVDGSAASTAALAWARENLITGDDMVCVLTAYSFPPIASETPVPMSHVRESERDARATAERAIRLVFGSDEPGRSIEHVVESGSIDHVVERHAADASFVVLGTRSRRRLRDRLRPSATNRITGRVECPVISVPVLRTAPQGRPR